MLRPSVVFGPEDDFLNRFAALAQMLWVVPVFSGGKAKLQPVYVGDVALAAASALEGRAEPGKVYELGGPAVMTLREMMALTQRIVGRHRPMVALAPSLSHTDRRADRVRQRCDARQVPRGADDDARSGGVARRRQCRFGGGGGRRAHA